MSRGLDPENELKRLLREHGMLLERTKKHQVYRHPDGRSFTISSSPSDIHAYDQALRTLRKFLGLSGPVKAKNRNPNRKPKAKANHAARPQMYLEITTVETKTWKAQLTAVRQQIAQRPPVTKAEKKEVKELRKLAATQLAEIMEKPKGGGDVMKTAMRKAGLTG